jgi:hypothetical protein
MHRFIGVAVSLCFAMSCAAAAVAQTPCATCQQPGHIYQPPRREIVERTIWVPQVTTERRTIRQQQMQPQQQQRTTTVYDSVPETVNVNRTVTVMQRRQVMQSQTQTVMRPFQRTITEQFAVPVQSMETRVATRQVAVMVPVRVQRRVTTQCNCTQSSPGLPSQTTQGQPVVRMVEQIVNQQRMVNQQFQVQVPVTRYVNQQRSRQVTEMRAVQQAVQVPVTIQVPQQQTRTDQVVQYRKVPRQVVQNYTVMKPVAVDQVIEVPVTKYVAQTVRQEIIVPGRYVPAPHSPPKPACPTCSRALQSGVCPQCQQSHGHYHSH